jgi:inner membrane protein
MRGLEHALIGAGAGAGIAHVAGGDLGLLMAAGAFAASLPDTDLRWAPRWYRPMPGSKAGVLEHRGPTHSLLAVATVMLAVHAWLGVLPLTLAIGAGYLSHLLADALSPMGVPFLWPALRWRYRLMPDGLRVRSGTRLIELPVAIAVLLASLSLR